MDLQELTDYVVHHLGEGDLPAELIYDVCEKMGWSWPQAESFVQHVRAEQEPQIAKRQFPILFTLALGIFLLGLALLAYGVYSLIQSWQVLKAIVEFIRTGHGLPTITVESSFQSYLDIGLGPLGGLFIGTAMILGSLVGMSRVWSSLLIKPGETPDEE